MPFSPSALASPTGATLRVYTLAPRAKPRAVVHINHGLAEHAARYERFAEVLAQRGYAAVAHDHRGHGATTAPDAPLGRFAAKDGFDAVLADVAAVHAQIAQKLPGAPIVCFGHSMGAMIAMNFALARPQSIAAAAIWNTAFDITPLYHAGRLLLLGERALKGSDVPSALAPKLTFAAWNKVFSPNRTGFDWLSRDASEVDKYVADPRCGFPCSVGLWLDVLGAIARVTDAAIATLPKSLPFHVAGGSQDPSTDKGRAMQRLSARLQKAGLTDVTGVTYEGSRHECLNDLDRDAIASRFCDWLDFRFPPDGHTTTH
jgi:alpha-beta hydrolase superfamily lysophospholipase